VAAAEDVAIAAIRHPGRLAVKAGGRLVGITPEAGLAAPHPSCDDAGQNGERNQFRDLPDL